MMSDLRKFWSQRQESNPQPTDYKGREYHGFELGEFHPSVCVVSAFLHMLP